MALPVLNYPTINGQRYSFASCRFLTAGLPSVGITSVTFDQDLEPGQVYSILAQKIGRTKGQLKPTASFEMLEAEYMQMIPALCEIAGTPGSGWMEAVFDMLIQYSENWSPMHMVFLRGCRIKKETATWKAGSEALFTKVDLDLFYYMRDGQAPLSVFSTAPAFIPG